MKHFGTICAVLSAFFIWMNNSVAGEVAISEYTGAEESVFTGAEDALLDWFEEKGLVLGQNKVCYPIVREGMVEEVLRERINAQILEDGKIPEYVTRVSQLISGGSLQVQWRGTVLGTVFSFAVSAEGAITTPRSTFVWTAGNIDLRDGHEITWEDLFSDPEKARETIEAYLEGEVAPELSAYLLNSQLTPLPELFHITERGLVLLYSIEQLSTLSDRAGDILIPWDVVQEQLDKRENGYFTDMELNAWLVSGENASSEELAQMAVRIQNATAKGVIPGIPVRLGERLQVLTDEWHLLIDPDVYTLGRFFSLEGSAFRGVFLMTDFLSESWENSLVDGIRVDVGSFFGLTVGKTPREIWRQALGEPDHTIDMDEEQAEAYRTVPGSRDYYVFGEHRLQLHADEKGVLSSIILSE